MGAIAIIKSIFGGVNPTQEGSIPVSWPQNFWQRAMSPAVNDACAMVGACADAYAQTVALLPIDHTKKDEDGGIEYLNSAAARVMRNPNSYQTGSDWRLNMARRLMTTGNAYAVAYRNNRNEVVELHIVPSESTSVYIEPESKSVFYGIGNNPMVGDIEALIPQRDVLHIKLYAPYNPLIGVSPLENAATSIAANQAITSHQAAFFNNMSRPSGVLSTDQVLKTDQVNALRDAWENQSQNINSGKVPILFGGLKFQQMALNSQDAQLVEAFGMTNEDIARAMRVPLPLVGDNSKSTYNNVEQLINAWLTQGLGFVLEHMEAALDKFFDLPADQHMNFETDMSLMRTDFDKRVDALTKGVQGGLYTVNEARAKERLPKKKDGDEPRLQAQVVPISAAYEPEPEPAPEPEPTPAEIDADAEKMIKAIRKQING